MTKTYHIGEAKTHLSSILEEVQHGIEVVLAKNRKPIARLSPIQPPKERPMGFLTMKDPEAFVQARLEPLPEDELRHWTGEA
jgi:antitoxin (DNA-binding transcriptional repressor) of toxin-antitoxin stability system